MITKRFSTKSAFPIAAVLIFYLPLENVTNAADLHKAAKRGKLADVVSLLESDAEVDIRDRKGRTPLMFATEGGHVDVAEVLLNAGAAPNIEDKKGRSALSEARSRSNPVLVEVFEINLARKANTESAYLRFQSLFPASEYRSEVAERLELVQWEAAQSQATSASYARYIEQNPLSPRVPQAAINLEARAWSEIVDDKDSTLEQYQTFLEQFPNGTHNIPAKHHIEYLKERRLRMTPDGRFLIDGPFPLDAGQFGGLVKRVESLIAPLTIEQLVGPQAADQGMVIGGAVSTGMQSVTRNDGVSVTVMSASRAGDPKPANIGVWHAAADQGGGFAGMFSGNSGKVVLRLHDPSHDSENPFGYERITLFGEKAEWEYTKENGQWVTRRYELSE